MLRDLKHSVVGRNWDKYFGEWNFDSWPAESCWPERKLKRTWKC